MVKKYKQIGLILIFFTHCVVISIWSITADWARPFQYGGADKSSQKEKSQESYFKKILYYNLENDRPLIFLDADELVQIPGDKKTIFINPKGTAYSQDNSEVIYKAQKGILDDNFGLLKLEKDVSLKTVDTLLLSDYGIYYMNEAKAFAEGNVKTKKHNFANGDTIFVNSREAISHFSTRKSSYIGDVNGHIKRKKVYEENVYFKSQILDFDEIAQFIELRDDVYIKKQGVTSTARRGEIFLENYNNKLKYFVLYDDVRVVEKVILEEDSYLRKAFGEKLEGYVAQDLMILTGLPKVFQKKDIIRGNRILLRENSEVIEVDDANSKFILK
jgi:lipopolysaccharide export system protein LptA